ncbi:DUF3043 domain-containing protein [Nocardioides lianchengensis]|uniref:DUF3043 domain-containing protein n=1 Tax=Nocardioides lianchengensis TaxID=1045774 RepID=A0A1G6N0C0_9ACTN|nr:DUF3043 domain-containing protein [Nocardioides lianchengensis]NYG10607.1 hypothetical protein [Nocardioides lianchengensis]SDC61141.1 Protein of unknown function [Nocardioides lianchengensis]
MFRRSKIESPSPESAEVKPGGKGRPTPSRKEAEAAARARAKTPRTRKEIAAAQRLARAESSQQVRTAMKTGDERYYMPRDKGPMRRFVRDFVDCRFTFLDILFPLLIVSMILGYTGVDSLMELSSFLLLATLLMLVFDIFRLRLRLRRELAARFPEESTKGTSYYAISRALNPRFLRMPKPQVKIGSQLPETYR